MARPITWQNVGTSGLNATGAALIRSGSNTLIDATRGLDNLAQRERQQNIVNQNTLVDKNTAAIANQLKQYGSLDELNAAKESGAFSQDTLTNQFGADNFDFSKITDTLGRTDNRIMQDETDQYNYEQTTDSRNDKPLLAQFQAALAKAGSTEEVNTIKDSFDFSQLSAGGQATAATMFDQKEGSQYSEDRNRTTDARNDKEYRITQDLRKAQEGLKADTFAVQTNNADAANTFRQQMQDAGIQINNNGTLVEGVMDDATYNQLVQTRGRDYANSVKTQQESNVATFDKALAQYKETAISPTEHSVQLMKKYGSTIGLTPAHVATYTDFNEQQEAELAKLPEALQGVVSQEHAQLDNEYAAGTADLYQQITHQQKISDAYSNKAIDEITNAPTTAKAEKLIADRLKNMDNFDTANLAEVMDQLKSTTVTGEGGKVRKLTPAEMMHVLNNATLNSGFGWLKDATLADPEGEASKKVNPRSRRGTSAKAEPISFTEAELAQGINHNQQMFINANKDLTALKQQSSDLADTLMKEKQLRTDLATMKGSYIKHF